MTQQTLREEFEKKFSIEEDYEGNYIAIHKNGTYGISNLNEIADFFLARFKEFAEKELIGSNKVAVKGVGIHGGLTHDEIARNALRNEQREILAEKLK